MMSACDCVQLGETPLHFACKFGFIDVINVLVGHPATDKQLRNIHGLLAKEVCYFTFLLYRILTTTSDFTLTFDECNVSWA